MPRFSPHMPQEGPPACAPTAIHQPPPGSGWKTPSAAIALGQHIQRECGMQGLRRYICAMSEFLSFDECANLARAFGLSPDICRPEPPPPPPPPSPPPPDPACGNSQLQMLQMMMQLMGSGGGGTNALAPLLLSQLMGGK